MKSIVAPALALAQLQASITRADTGVGNARLKFYSTATPDAPGTIAGTPMAVILLAKPCATIAGGVMTWRYDDPALVTTGGVPRTCVWEAADGSQLHIGDVTDMDHDGAYKVEGGATAPGDDSPTLYAGGTLTPGASVIE